MTIKIQTLGGLKVLKDEVERPELRARKLRCALLIYLGIEGEATKDTLTHVFWPDDETTKVSSRLSSNIKSIRDDCGPDCIQTHGDSYKANPELLGVDVPRFRAAVGDGKYQAALGLYGGAFLAGEHLSGSGQFEAWREKVEDEVEGLHRRALRLRVDELVKSGRLQDAADIAEQWATTYPVSERGNHAYAQLLAMTGEPARALRHLRDLYDRLDADGIVVPGSLHDLRRSIEAGEFQSGLEPISSPALSPDRVSEDRPKYAPHEDIEGGTNKDKPKKPPPPSPPRGQGIFAWIGWAVERLSVELKTKWVYRISLALAAIGSAGQLTILFVDPPKYLEQRLALVYVAVFAMIVATTWAVEHYLHSPKREPGTDLAQGWGLITWRGFPVLATTTLAASVAIGLWPDRPVPGVEAGGEYRENHIAILYFEQLREGEELEVFGTQLTRALIQHFTDLRDVSPLTVASANAVDWSRNRSLPRGERARELQAELVVDGSLDVVGDSVLVTVEMADPRTGDSHMSETFRRSVEGTWEWSLIEDISTEISERLRGAIGPIVRRRFQPGTDNPDAWRTLGQGETRFQAARSLLYSDDSAAFWAEMDRTQETYDVAARLDSDWAEPLIGLGRLHAYRAMVLGDLQIPPNRDGAIREIELGLDNVARALRLDPGNGRAYQQEGTLLYFRWRNTTDPDAARDFLERAEESLGAAAEADQTLARARRYLSQILFDRGEYLSAKLRAQEAFDADAFLEHAIPLLNTLALTELNLGEDVAAREHCREIQTRMPTTSAGFECELEVLAWGEGLPADLDAAWALADTILALGRSDPQITLQPRVLMDVAGVLGRAEFTDSARAVLDRAKASKPGSTVLWQEAAAEVRLGDHRASIDIARRYVETEPVSGQVTLRWRIFDPLRAHPDFLELFRDSGG